MKGEKGKEYVREMKKNKKKREIKASWGEREKNEEGGNGDTKQMVACDCIRLTFII